MRVVATFDPADPLGVDLGAQVGNIRKGDICRTVTVAFSAWAADNRRVEDDLSDLEYAPTRSSLLRTRGYAEEIIAGNGHVALAESPVTLPEPAPGESVIGGERVCQGCGASLAGRRPNATWCSRSCKERHTRSPRVTGAPATPAPVAGGCDRLAEVVVALTGAGLTVALAVDGVELTVRA